MCPPATELLRAAVRLLSDHDHPCQPNTQLAVKVTNLVDRWSVRICGAAGKDADMTESPPTPPSPPAAIGPPHWRALTHLEERVIAALSAARKPPGTGWLTSGELGATVEESAENSRFRCLLSLMVEKNIIISHNRKGYRLWLDDADLAAR